MPLINTSVPNLIQGVSQQPDASRFAGQCEEQENALSSVADGLKKRPNTRHIARLLETAIDEDSFVHFINRSDSEKYVVIHDGTKLYAYNIISGAEATINGYTGGLTISAGDYLQASTPRANIKALTIADSTLLLNSSKSIAPKTTKTAEISKEALVYIAQGDYRKTYRVDVEVTTAGNAPTPPSTVLPTISVNMERYEYRYVTGSSGRARTTRYETWTYRWRIASVSITSTGSNIQSPLSINVTSNLGIYTQPSLSPVVIGGQLSSVTLVAKGDFEGAGTRLTGSTYDKKYYYGENAPTISNSISGGGSISSAYLFAKTKSEDSTDAQHANSDVIASRLRAEMVSNVDATNGGGFNSYFTVSRPNNGNNIYLDLSSPTQYDFTISTTDSLADRGMKSIYREVDSITSLPAENKNGFKVKVKGDPELAEDDYYVEFKTNQGQAYGSGSYVETVGDDIVTGVDASTMPHQLVNDAVNSFTFGEVNYADRVAGDDDSNPLPSFTGSEITSMFFFKNRLGFLSKENIAMSESGFGNTNDQGQTVFNFGRTSITSLLDSDPIDVSVASSRVTNLKAAKGFQENLVLFSENGQFVLKGGDVLTPKSVSITPITNFSFEDQVDPLPLGSYIYFPFTRGAYTGMREFTVNASTDVYDSIEVTEHVPAYIPRNIIDMAGTTSEDMIVLLSGDEKGSLYIYNYFWNNNQKVLSAWSKFTFTGEIRGIEFVESSLYAVIVNNGETNLVEMPLESGLTDANGYVTHLDMRVSATVTNGSSTITLPYTPEDNSVEVYTDDGLKLTATNSGATVTLNQAVTEDTEVFVGIPYTMKYTFSEQLFKAKAGNGTSPSNAAKLMVRNGSIYFDDTAYFQVKVTPKARNTSVNTFTPDVVGSTTIGSLSLDSGFYRFPVFTKAQDTTITIENDSALPSNFQSAEFESFVHSRSNRYG
jgi:hypothetical protein